MADKEKKEKAKKPIKSRAKAPKILAGDFPYASLMPKTRREAIEVSEAKTKWLKTVGGGVIIAIVIAVAAVGFKVVHQISYDAAQAKASTVESSILEYGPVDQALSIKQSIENNMKLGAKNEINWGDTYNRIQQNLPDGSALKSMDVQTGGTKDDPEVISVLVTISSQRPISYADILTSFIQIPGITGESIQIGNLTSNGSGGAEAALTYEYPVAFAMDSSVLSTRFEDPSEADADTADSDNSTAKETAGE